MGVFGLLARGPSWHARDIICFEDNAVAVPVLVKESSRSQCISVEVMSAHLARATLRCRSWWEYVESSANWMDQASRLLEDGGWAPSRGFSLECLDIPLFPWTADFSSMRALVRAALGAAAGKEQRWD